MSLITKIITSDSKIWNLNEVYSDICFAMSKNLDLIICCNSEGPDIRCLGLDKFIESESQRYGYDLRKILIQSKNVIEKYDSVLVQKKFPKHLMTYSLEYDNEIIKCDDLKHFGLFIGKSNAPRLFLGAYLYKKYKDQTVHTNWFNLTNDFYCANIGIEDLHVRYGIKNIDEIANYLMQCPINGFPASYQKNSGINHAQYLLTKDKEHFVKLYESFFVEIVCETYFSGETFFPTEKTWRPMLLKTPFIIQGPKGYLKNLKKLGFRTFSDWWSEGYDEDDPGTSWHEITKIIDYLSCLSFSELYQMLEQMKDTLEHNRTRFFELYESKIPHTLL
jgi:hypothetical protein